MKQTVFIGIDDTDVIGGPGTGRVARGLAEYLESLDLGRARGVIRHQLLVDPRIPYTSHNSGKTIEFITDRQPEDLLGAGAKYLRDNFQKGADPGICVCTAKQATQELMDYGHLAQNEFITKKQAIYLAKKLGILLSEVGGTGDGIIGALASAGLAADGNDGRYVQMRGIKEVQGLITVGQVLKTTEITSVVDQKGFPVDAQETIDSKNWLRPSRIGGEPVLRLRAAGVLDGRRLWWGTERKMKDHDDA